MRTAPRRTVLVHVSARRLYLHPINYNKCPSLPVGIAIVEIIFIMLKPVLRSIGTNFVMKVEKVNFWMRLIWQKVIYSTTVTCFSAKLFILFHKSIKTPKISVLIHQKTIIWRKKMNWWHFNIQGPHSTSRYICVFPLNRFSICVLKSILRIDY